MMRRFLVGTACVLGLTLSAACATPAPVDEGPTDAEMIAAADALDDTFIAAMNAGDAEALAALYSADAVSYPPDAMMAAGTAAIRAGYTKMVTDMAGAQFELTERHHMVVGDAVFSYGLWRATVPVPDGDPMVMEGRFTDLKAERDGTWVYLVDHASAPMPPPEGM